MQEQKLRLPDRHSALQKLSTPFLLSSAHLFVQPSHNLRTSALFVLHWSFLIPLPFFLYKSALNPVFPEGNIRKHRVMLCFPGEDRHFLHYSPVNFQALHRNWTNINHPSISSGTSPEVWIAFIDKELVSLPPHCTLRSSLETAQCCRNIWLRKAKLIRSRRFVLNQGWRRGTGKGWRQLQDSPRTTQGDIWANAALNPCSSTSAKQSSRWVPQCSNPPCQASCPAAPCGTDTSPNGKRHPPPCKLDLTKSS